MGSYLQLIARPSLVWRQVVIVVGVAAVHGLMLAVWLSAHSVPAAVQPEMMAVTLLPEPEVLPPTVAPVPLPVTAPQTRPRSVTPPSPTPTVASPAPDKPDESATAPTLASAAPQTAASPVSPAVPLATADTEPDYHAAYLHNPPPVYPMSARRMGIQGRVVLHVEVQADGICGQITIRQSSGYAMLDNAALQTVRNWHFAPARHAGQAVSRWFLVPIQFSLKDNEV